MNLLKIRMAISSFWFRLLDVADVFLDLSVTTPFAGNYFVKARFLCRECTLRYMTGIKMPSDAVVAVRPAHLWGVYSSVHGPEAKKLSDAVIATRYAHLSGYKDIVIIAENTFMQ